VASTRANELMMLNSSLTHWCWRPSNHDSVMAKVLPWRRRRPAPHRQAREREQAVGRELDDPRVGQALLDEGVHQSDDDVVVQAVRHHRVGARDALDVDGPQRVHRELFFPGLEGAGNAVLRQRQRQPGDVALVVALKLPGFLPRVLAHARQCTRTGCPRAAPACPGSAGGCAGAARYAGGADNQAAVLHG
jgi:hypothetical protein